MNPFSSVLRLTLLTSREGLTRPFPFLETRKIDGLDILVRPRFCRFFSIASILSIILDIPANSCYNAGINRGISGLTMQPPRLTQASCCPPSSGMLVQITKVWDAWGYSFVALWLLATTIGIIATCRFEGSAESSTRQLGLLDPWECAWVIAGMEWFRFLSSSYWRCQMFDQKIDQLCEARIRMVEKRIELARRDKRLWCSSQSKFNLLLKESIVSRIWKVRWNSLFIDIGSPTSFGERFQPSVNHSMLSEKRLRGSDILWRDPQFVLRESWP